MKNYLNYIIPAFLCVVKILPVNLIMRRKFTAEHIYFTEKYIDFFAEMVYNIYVYLYKPKGDHRK